MNITESMVERAAQRVASYLFPDDQWHELVPTMQEYCRNAAQSILSEVTTTAPGDVEQDAVERVAEAIHRLRRTVRGASTTIFVSMLLATDEQIATAALDAITSILETGAQEDER